MNQNNEKPRSDSDPQQQLYDGMGFDKDDLAANRAGQLSQNQLARLASSQQWRLAYMTILLALAIVFTAIVSRSSNPTSGPNQQVTLIGILWIAVVLAEPLLIFRWYRNRQEIMDGAIDSFEGTIERRRMMASGRGGGTSHTVGVSGKHFDVRREVYDAFLHDHRYRLYVTPISGRLLSAEYLD